MTEVLCEVSLFSSGCFHFTEFHYLMGKIQKSQRDFIFLSQLLVSPVVLEPEF